MLFSTAITQFLKSETRWSFFPFSCPSHSLHLQIVSPLPKYLPNPSFLPPPLPLISLTCANTWTLNQFLHFYPHFLPIHSPHMRVRPCHSAYTLQCHPAVFWITQTPPHSSQGQSSLTQPASWPPTTSQATLLSLPLVFQGHSLLVLPTTCHALPDCSRIIKYSSSGFSRGWLLLTL